MIQTVEALGSELDEVAVTGIAQVAEEAFIQAQLDGKSVHSIRKAVEASVYWPRFMAIVLSGHLPSRWLPGPLGKVVAGWAGQPKAVQPKVRVNPKLPANFDSCPNDRRPQSHQRWWHVPYIVTYGDDSPEWLANWPSGTRYDVRCLDGGAWDRSTWWGSFATLEEAIRYAENRQAFGGEAR